MSVTFIYLSAKKTTFFENINQEHNLIPDCPCLWTAHLCTHMWKCMSGFSAFILTTGNILFGSMINGNWNGNYLFNTASFVTMRTAWLGKIWFSSYGQSWLSTNEVSVFFNRQYFINILISSIDFWNVDRDEW